jgi:hypothetical protein
MIAFVDIVLRVTMRGSGASPAVSRTRHEIGYCTTAFATPDVARKDFIEAASQLCFRSMEYIAFLLHFFAMPVLI